MFSWPLEDHYGVNGAHTGEMKTFFLLCLSFHFSIPRKVDTEDPWKTHGKRTSLAEMRLFVSAGPVRTGEYEKIYY